MKRRVFLGFPLLLAGCAGVQPVTQVRIQEPEGIEFESEGLDREVQVSARFTGGLTTCGLQKNAAFLDVGSVECRPDPGEALPPLLISALRKAGFKVSVGAITAKAYVLQIDGEVLQFFTEPVSRVANDTDIYLALTAKSATGLLAERRLYEKGRGGDAQRSVNSAARKIMQATVQAVVELMDQYPMLGRPPEAVPKKRTSRD